MSSSHDNSVRQHAHHFESAHHEFESCKQGMWLFLLQEVLFFSGIFVAYAVIRGLNPEMFAAAAGLLDVKMGLTNTIILITSSLTMAMAVNAAQTDKKEHCVWYLIATFFLACGFLVVKYFEYSHKFHMGILPGAGFLNPSDTHIIVAQTCLILAAACTSFFVARSKTGFRLNKKSVWISIVFWAVSLYLTISYWMGSTGEHQIVGQDAQNLVDQFAKAPLFFSVYFGATGIHGIHVLGGMVVIAWLISRAEDAEFNSKYFTPVEMVGLYWHFVDLVWIFLFPLMYLVA